MSTDFAADPDSQAVAVDDDDAAAAVSGSKAMLEFFHKRYKAAARTTLEADDAHASSSITITDADSRSLASDRLSADVNKEYAYYHTVSSSDARVLRAALAKERIPIFRRSDSKARRSMAGAGMRSMFPAKERMTEGLLPSQVDSQSLSSARSDVKSFRDIFLRRRNRSDRSEVNTDVTTEVKQKSGSIRRMRNFLVSFRPRPRSVSVSYAPVEAMPTSSAAGVAAGSTPSTAAQTVGKKKKFRVTPATLLPSLKRPERPRVGPEDFVEMYCRSRTTSDPRADAILKARVAANLHKVEYNVIIINIYIILLTLLSTQIVFPQKCTYRTSRPLECHPVESQNMSHFCKYFLSFKYI